ncbi:hypothetical protein QBC37DRAFT_449527 [Rhypophila decipiens]|uniref:Uncharacterized protein n=1 Tax=Rhypophila decipiens TaxID=261697 RepID=A0AAN6Y233_9PEZI|nr:hypothetical protein QBC37DRAFT_449527 [Rhypophila decipiens]
MSSDEKPSLFDDDEIEVEVEMITTILKTTFNDRRQPSFVTLTSPDEPTHSGVAEVLPLTTIWKPLDSAPCQDSGFQGNAEDVIRSCLAPHAQNVWEFNGHYSPGICPQDWRLACTGSGSMFNGKTIDRDETVALCVPATISNIVCRNDRSKVRLFTTAYQYAYDVDVLPLEVRWRSSDLSILQTTPDVKGVPGPVTKLTFEYVRKVPAEVSRAFRKEVKALRRDDAATGIWETDWWGSSETWSVSAPVATSGASDLPPPPDPEAYQNGPSSGAIAGIAVGAGAFVLLVIAAAFFLWRRKRRQRRSRRSGEGPSELHGNQRVVYEKDSGRDVVEKDATPIKSRTGEDEEKLSFHKAGAESPVIPPEPVELPSTPRQAVLAPLPNDATQREDTSKPKHFPYSYMGSAPQWQTYQELEPPSLAMTNTPFITPPPAVTTEKDGLPKMQQHPQPPQATAPSNMAYQVEREQLARLQERRKRLLELERIDREEEEILKRIQEQEQNKAGKRSGGVAL